MALTYQNSGELNVEFHGDKTAYAILVYKHILFSLLTLGIYRFWGKTNIRRYLWEHTTLDGRPFEYLGTARELYMGFVKLFVFIIGYIALSAVGAMIGGVTQVIIEIVLQIGIFIAIPFAIYGSRRYLMSRTRYRGVMFGQAIEGRGEYAKSFYVGGFLTLITFFIYAPWNAVNLRRILTDNTRFGSEYMKYDATGGQFMGLLFKLVGILLVVLAGCAAAGYSVTTFMPKELSLYLVPALAVGFYIFLFAYTSAMQAPITRFHAEHTAISGYDLRCALTGMDIIKIQLISFLITLFSLGLLFPFATIYRYEKIMSSFYLDGPVNWRVFEGRQAGGDSALDDLADALDVEADVFDAFI